MGVRGILNAADAAIKRNQAAPTSQWSFRGQRRECFAWASERLADNEKIARVVIDVSDVLYPLFVTEARKLAREHRAMEEPCEETIRLEWRRMELRQLNVFLARLKEDLPRAEEIIAVWDNPTMRRETKMEVTEVARQTRAVEAEAKSMAGVAIARHRLSKRRKEPNESTPSSPSIETGNRKEWPHFPPFAPPSPSELDTSIERTGKALEIHKEALDLVRAVTIMVSKSEADSVCRNASLGWYDPNTPMDRHMNPHETLATFRASESRQAPPEDGLKRLSVIVGRDSDHLVLNDHLSAAFVFGLSSNNECRATDLRARRTHPSDWGYHNRYAQLLAASVIGCDESIDLPGFTVAGVARANRSVLKPSNHLLHERTLLGFFNQVGMVLDAYKELRHGSVGSSSKVDTKLFSKDDEERSLSWKDLEVCFQAMIQPMFKATAKVPKFEVTFETTMDVFFGIAYEKGLLASKEDLRAKIEETQQTQTNRQLRLQYSSPDVRNHAYSCLKPKLSGNPPPPAPPQPQPHLPYKVRRGPDTSRFWTAQQLESNKLASQQEESRKREQTADPAANDNESEAATVAKKKGVGKKTEKTSASEEFSADSDGEEDEVDDGTAKKEKKKKKAPIGVGLKQFNLSLSTVSFPFATSSISNLEYPGIPAGHTFRHDLIEVLSHILRMWLNVCPAIVETLNSILRFLSEFAPSLLDEWAKGGHGFTNRTSAVVISLGRLYDEFPLSSPLPLPSPQQGAAGTYPTSLATRLAAFMVHVPERQQRRFRKTIEEARFTEDELEVIFGNNQLIDLACAVVIKKRRIHGFPPLAITHKEFIDLNFVTCGSTFSTATTSRSKNLATFVGQNILLSFTTLFQRAASNRLGVGCQILSQSHQNVQRLDPATVSSILSSLPLKTLTRLIRLRIEHASLPSSADMPSRPAPAANAQPQYDDGGDDAMDGPAKDDNDEDMAAESHASPESDDDSPADASELYDVSTTALFQAKLEEVLAGTITRRTSMRAPDVVRYAQALSKLVCDCVNFCIEFLGQAYLESIKSLSKSARKGWKDVETIGDLVVAVGGKRLKKMKTTERFIGREGRGEGDNAAEDATKGGEEAEEEASGDEDEEEGEGKRVSSVGRVARRMILDLLPVLGLPFLRFKPTAFSINMPILQSFVTASNPHYLPPRIRDLIHVIAVESVEFNKFCLSRHIRVPNFPEIDFEQAGLEEDDVKRNVSDSIHQLGFEDKFVKSQRRRPDKVLSWVNNHWGLPLEEDPNSLGPNLVLWPTRRSNEVVTAQCETLRHFTRALGLPNQDDAVHVAHEILNMIFSPAIGVRLFHGNFSVDGFKIRALVHDPRFLTPLGAKKFGSLVEGKPWTRGLEALASSHEKLIGAYEKMDRKRQSDEEAKQGGNVGGVKIVRDFESLEEVPRIFKLVRREPSGRVETEAEDVNAEEEREGEEKEEEGEEEGKLEPTVRPGDKRKRGKAINFPRKEAKRSDDWQVEYVDRPTASAELTIDPRRGYYLPYRKPFSEKGQRTVENWSQWINGDLSAIPDHPPPSSSAPPHFVENDSLSRDDADSDPGPGLLAFGEDPPIVDHRTRAVAFASGSSSAIQPSEDSAASGRFSDPTPARTLPMTKPSGSRNVALPACGPLETIPEGQARPITTSQLEGGGAASTRTGGDSTDDGDICISSGTPSARRVLIGVDEGRNVLVDMAIVDTAAEKIQFVRIPSGPKIRSDRVKQARLQGILEFEERVRWATGFAGTAPATEGTQDLSVLLRRPPSQDAADNAPRFVEKVDFESQTLVLPPPLQAGILHAPSYLRAKLRSADAEKSARRRASEAATRWIKLIPEPENGKQVRVALVLPYGHISGGVGYGRQASRTTTEADIRALRSIPWIDFLLVRSVESYTSQVCCKPGCGGSVVHPQRLSDGSNILRLVICLRCLEVRHRDDNAALNTARIALAVAQGVEGNLLTPENAQTMGYKWRTSKQEKVRLENTLRKVLLPLTEQERRSKLESLRAGDDISSVVAQLAEAAEPEASRMAEAEDREVLDEEESEVGEEECWQ